MIDRQRAFVCALVYVIKNKRFCNYHRIGVKRIPDGARMYEFNGTWQKDSISVQDDKYNKVIDNRFYENPYGVQVRWVSRSQDLKIRASLKDSHFYGQDGEYYRFEGDYYSPGSKIEIRDRSTDRYKYAYRIMW